MKTNRLKSPENSISHGHRILIVDDHPLMREGVANWINREPDLEVCGEADTASEALLAIQNLRPDLVLTDIALPGRNGLELIKDVQALNPMLPVVVLSLHDENLYAGRALRAGARGYVMKRAGGERVVSAIREVLRGRMALNPDMAIRLLEEYSGRRPRAMQSTLSALTDREFVVFGLLGEGKTNKEIAGELHLSHKTVESHRLNICRKLKLKTTAELIRYAVQYAEKEAAGG
jgi:DNA-binding NarL/FixJ family response regulator